MKVRDLCLVTLFSLRGQVEGFASFKPNSLSKISTSNSVSFVLKAGTLIDSGDIDVEEEDGNSKKVVDDFLAKIEDDDEEVEEAILDEEEMSEQDIMDRGKSLLDSIQLITTPFIDFIIFFADMMNKAIQQANSR